MHQPYQVRINDFLLNLIPPTQPNNTTKLENYIKIFSKIIYSNHNKSLTFIPPQALSGVNESFKLSGTQIDLLLDIIHV